MCRKFAIDLLEQKGFCTIKCNGNSMRPLINPKETIYLKKVLPHQIRVGDTVFCRVSKMLCVHLVHSLDKKTERFTISNIKGFINGTIGPKSIFGLAVQVEDRVLVSEEELKKRLNG